ncbi:hypothetical protein AAG906_011694 [Vitis piasezkii]
MDGETLVSSGQIFELGFFSPGDSDIRCDTYLPGMKFGWNLETGQDWHLTSWRNASDPSPGDFTYRIDIIGLPQVVLRSGSEKKLRSGPWNGLYFNSSNKWDVMYTVQNDQCDNYGHSGANGICRIDNRPICECLDRFGQGFIKLRGVDLSDLLKFWENTSMTGKECEVECLKSCSCTAYTNSNISRGGSGFFIWFGDLIDIRELVQDIEQLIYIRIPASELELMGDSSIKKHHLVILVVALMAFGVLVFGLIIWIIVWKKRRGKRGKHTYPPLLIVPKEKVCQQEQKEDQELPLFNLVTVASATNNFSDRNMIGNGGFGFVYKGILSMGQEIAVKRLLTDSRQGLQEFKNEKRSELMAWQMRLDIVMGVSRGLLYLHQDSRLRGPFIETSKPAIYYLMYAIDGKFSAKSDVFGFGVLLLEIAWMLWNEDKALELMDECLRDSCVESQVLRCIQVGLLCVQKLPTDRRTMPLVIFMLGHEEAVLSQPKQPCFFIERSSDDDEGRCHTENEITVTMLEAG